MGQGMSPEHEPVEYPADSSNPSGISMTRGGTPHKDIPHVRLETPHIRANLHDGQKPGLISGVLRPGSRQGSIGKPPVVSHKIWNSYQSGIKDFSLSKS
jgi:hypothetical protein